MTLVLRGRSTADISRSAGVSPHTVQDHLKSVFDKTGVRSRRDLVAPLFARHYLPDMSPPTLAPQRRPGTEEASPRICRLRPVRRPRRRRPRVCPGSGCYAAPNSGALHARSDVYGGSWEGFTFEWIGEESKSTFVMKFQANGLYVAVEENYTGASQNLLLSSPPSAATSTPLRDVVERPQPWAIWAAAQ